MRESNPSELLAIATDLGLELERMKRLEQDILVIQQEIQRDPDRAHLFMSCKRLSYTIFIRGVNGFLV